MNDLALRRGERLACPDESTPRSIILDYGFYYIGAIVSLALAIQLYRWALNCESGP